MIPCTCGFIHIQPRLSQHNNPYVWYLPFCIQEKTRSKHVIVAVRLGCSVATQANFDSAALTAYMWNGITFQFVGGFGICCFFFSTIFVTLLCCSPTLYPFFLLPSISLFCCYSVFGHLLQATLQAQQPLEHLCKPITFCFRGHSLYDAIKMWHHMHWAEGQVGTIESYVYGRY